VAEEEGSIIQSSIRRMEAISKHPPVKCRQDVIDILSDQTGKDYRVYQEFGRDDDEIKTIATGMLKSGSRIFVECSFFYLLFCLHFPRAKIGSGYIIILWGIKRTVVYVNIYLLETKKRYAQERLHHIYLRISCCV